MDKSILYCCRCEQPLAADDDRCDSERAKRPKATVDPPPTLATGCGSCVTWHATLLNDDVSLNLHKLYSVATLWSHTFSICNVIQQPRLQYPSPKQCMCARNSPCCPAVPRHRVSTHGILLTFEGSRHRKMLEQISTSPLRNY